MIRFLLSLVLVFSFLGCTKDPDEKAIRELIEMMRTTAQKKEFQKTLAPLTKEYTDNFNGTRDQLTARMSNVFSPYDRLIIKAPIQKIEKSGMTAIATVKMYAMGAQKKIKSFIFGSPLTPKNVDIYLEKRLGQWRITGALIVK